MSSFLSRKYNQPECTTVENSSFLNPILGLITFMRVKPRLFVFNFIYTFMRNLLDQRKILPIIEGTSLLDKKVVFFALALFHYSAFLHRLLNCAEIFQIE